MKSILGASDGKPLAIDVERLWRSLEYEEVYLHAYESAREATAGVGRCFTFDNEKRPHQALGYQTPAELDRAGLRAAA